MKTLYLGDPHVQVSNLDESQKLVEFVAHTAAFHHVDRIVLPGDLLHTHAVIRSEVLQFWNNWLEILSKDQELIVLVGNHDMVSNNNSSIHALKVFNRIANKNLTIIDKPTLFGSISFMPYVHDPVHFKEQANELAKQGSKTLVCHQTFSGSKYENGFFAPDGVNPDDINFDLIISGHIHSRQRFGKVIYPGTGRWLTASDANQPKGLWLVDHSEDGSIAKEEFIDTSHVCQPIVSYEWKEGEESPIIPENSRATVELIGSSTWINKQKSELKGRVSIKSKITDKARPESRKSGNNLQHFLLNNFEPIAGLNREILLKYMQELKLV